MDLAMEKLIDNAFAGLGSKSRHASGFRMQEKNQQTLGKGGQVGLEAESGLCDAIRATTALADFRALPMTNGYKSAMAAIA